MKKLLFVFFGSIAFLGGHGQDSTQKQPGTYIFDHFMEGTVLQKTGAAERAILNYDAESQSIIFQQNGQNMILTGLENVDTVYIGEKKFVVAEDRFYAIGTSTEIPLLISYTSKPVPLQAHVDHNGTSVQGSSTVSNNVSEVYLNRRYEGRFTVEFIPQFWLKIGHSLYKANNKKQIIRVFPRQESRINEFLSNNKINFQEEKDVARLVTFGSQ